MELGLTGRSALVAAGSSGLGLGAACALAAEGADVAICARDPDRLATAHERIDAAGPGRVHSAVVDLTEPDAVRDWVRDAHAEFGRLHIVVSNTGGVPYGPADAFTVADYRSGLDNSMLPHISLVLAAFEHLVEAGWGRIVLITSEAVRQPIPDIALSGVTRVGVLAFARGMVHVLGSSGVTINALAPGYHRTPALEGTFGSDLEAELSKVAERVPLGGIGDPANFGALVTFLASEQASFVTGAVLPVDGGRTLGLP